MNLGMAEGELRLCVKQQRSREDVSWGYIYHAYPDQHPPASRRGLLLRYFISQMLHFLPFSNVLIEIGFTVCGFFICLSLLDSQWVCVVFLFDEPSFTHSSCGRLPVWRGSGLRGSPGPSKRSGKMSDQIPTKIQIRRVEAFLSDF